MSTLEMNAIRDYLLEVGCKIEYSILVNAFKGHLYNPDQQVQAHIRTQFKDFVNRLAIVSQEPNTKRKFIILRPEFRPADLQGDFPDSAKSPPTNHHDSKLARIEPTPKPPPPAHRLNLANQQSAPSPAPQQTKRQHHAQQPPPVPKVKVPQSVQHLERPMPPTPPQTVQMIPPPPLPVQRHESRPTHQHSSPLQQQNNLYRFEDQKHPQPSMPPPPVAARSQSLQRPGSLNLSSNMPPPRPPPRRRLSTASLFKHSPKPIIEKSREITDLAKKSLGKVKEHALKLNSSMSSNDINALVPSKNMSMKENRPSRDYSLGGSIGSALQRSGSHITTRSRSSHREDESDSSSLQPIDALKRKWVIEACSCNYNGLLTLLRDDPKLVTYKDIVNGYTALHWAAKFGNLDIIKLMAGTHGVSPNIKSSAGYTPLHLACMFQRSEAVDLLIKSYKANFNIRDHSGKRPMQYWQKQPS